MPPKISLSGGRSSTLVGLVVAVLILGAVGSIAYYQFEVAPSQNASTSSSTTSVVCGASNCAHVNIDSGAGSCIDSAHPCGYSVLSITVVIGVNNTVMWTSDDSSIHTVTGSGWTSPNLNQGDTFQHTFTVAGTYQYHCIYHAGMQAQVIVKS